MLFLLEIYKCILFVRVMLTKKEISKMRTVFHAKFMRGTNILGLPKPCTTTYGLNSLTYTAAKFGMLYHIWQIKSNFLSQ